MPTSDRSHQELRPSDRRPRLASLIACWIWLCAPLALVAEEFIFSVSHGDLYAVDPYDGSAQLIGDTSLSRSPSALAHGPDGLLYAAGSMGAGDELFIIDPETAEATPIGPLDVENPVFLELTFDALGQLWLAAGNPTDYTAMLYQVDPSTGAVTPLADYDRLILGLAARGDELFALTHDLADQDHVELIDRETFQLTPLFDVNIDSEWIIGATFDARGRLWILTRSGGILAVVPLAFYEVTDLSSGEVVERFSEVFHFTHPLAGMFNLASRGPALPPTDVPALDGAGLGVFLVLLLAGGLVLLKRRNRQAVRALQVTGDLPSVR